MTVIDKLYRFQEVHTAPPLDEFEHPCGEGNTHVNIYTYPVISQTPKGAWINLYFGGRKFVLLSARKRFACPTIEEARESFLARKQRQLNILDGQRRRVLLAIEAAKITSKPLPELTFTLTY